MTWSRLSLKMVALAAAVLDVAAVIVATYDSWPAYVAAVVVHLVAAFCVHLRVEQVCAGQAASTLAVLGTVAVPVFGPFLTMTLSPNNDVSAEKRARAALEEYDRWVHYDQEPHRPSPFAGDFDEDFVTFASVESHAVILRSGTGAQKREVLSRLVDSERPELVALVRDALTDQDPEVRLLAYAELQRLEGRLYDELETAREAQRLDPDDPAVQAAPVLAHRRLASAGVLDEAISAWHGREAERLEKELGSVVEAGVEIGAGTMDGPADPEEIAAAAFRERSFFYVRAYAKALAEDGHDIPEWIRALGPPVQEEAA